MRNIIRMLIYFLWLKIRLTFPFCIIAISMKTNVKMVWYCCVRLLSMLKFGECILFKSLNWNQFFKHCGAKKNSSTQNNENEKDFKRMIITSERKCNQLTEINSWIILKHSFRSWVYSSYLYIYFFFVSKRYSALHFRKWFFFKKKKQKINDFEIKHLPQ